MSLKHTNISFLRLSVDNLRRQRENNKKKDKPPPPPHTHRHTNKQKTNKQKNPKQNKIQQRVSRQCVGRFGPSGISNHHRLLGILVRPFRFACFQIF